MKPEILTSITNAKGAPLDGTKGATLLEVAERTQWFKRGTGDANGSVRWNAPRGDRSYKAPAWSDLDFALACKDMTPRPYSAVRYEYARDESQFHPLRRHLTNYAIELGRRLSWPNTVRTEDGETPFMERLVVIHLLEVWQPWRFVRGGESQTWVQGVLMKCEPHVWDRTLQPVYEAIGDEYRRLIAIALKHMRQRLREDGLRTS